MRAALRSLSSSAAALRSNSGYITAGVCSSASPALPPAHALPLAGPSLLPQPASARGSLLKAGGRGSLLTATCSSSSSSSRLVARFPSPRNAFATITSSSSTGPIVIRPSSRSPDAPTAPALPSEPLSCSSWRGFSLPFAVEPDEALDRDLASCAAQPITSFTLRQLYQYGVSKDERNILASARFLHDELATRFAQRVQFLKDLPYGLGAEPLARAIQRHYAGSFTLLRESTKPTTIAEAHEFTGLVRFLLARSASVNAASLSLLLCRAAENRLHPPPWMAAALAVADADADSAAPRARPQESVGPALAVAEPLVLQDVLDQFHASRLEARLLLTHHLALASRRQGFVGILEVACRPADVVREAADAAAVWVRARLSLPADAEVPEVHVSGAVGLGFRFPRASLLLVTQELLQRAFESTMRVHLARVAAATEGKGEGEAPHVCGIPPVTVVLSESDAEVIMRVSDQGGGIPRAEMDLVWSYYHQYYLLKAEFAATAATNAIAAAAAAAAAASAGAAPPAGSREGKSTTVTAAAEAAASAVAGTPAPGGVAGHGETSLSPALVRMCWGALQHQQLSAVASVDAKDPANPPVSANEGADDGCDSVEAEAAAWLSLPSGAAPPLTGLPSWSGFGLPVARMVARYLDGDLRVASLHGLGTDYYLYLPKIVTSTQVVEPAPDAVNVTPAEHSYV